jgi:O-antigen/teichoic acid export membrane protein
LTLNTPHRSSGGLAAAGLETSRPQPRLASGRVAFETPTITLHKAMANRGKMALVGMFFMLLRSVFLIGGALVTTPLIMKRLGRESYGVWSLVQDVVGYGTLADLGLGTSTVMHLSRFEGERNAQAYSNTLQSAKRHVRWQGFLVCLVLLGLVLVFPWVFEVQDVPTTVVRWTVLICGLRVAVTLLGLTNTSVLKSAGRYDWLSFQETLVSVVMLGVLILLAALGSGLVGLAVSQFVVAALSQFSYFWMAARFQDRDLLVPPTADPELESRLRNYGKSTIWSKVAGRVNAASGSVILGFLQGPSSLAFYAPAVSLITRVNSIMVLTLDFLGPVMARALGQGDQAGFRRVFFLSSRFAACLSLLIASSVVLYGREFLMAWLDDAEVVQKSYPLLALLGLLLGVSIPSIPGNNLFLALGNVELLKQRGISEAIVSSLLQFVLALWLGPLGVVLGTMVSTFAIRGVMQLSLVGTKLSEPAARIAKDVYLRPLLSLIPVLIAAGVLKTFVPLGQLRTLMMGWGVDVGEGGSRLSRLLTVGEIGLHGLVLAFVMGVGCLAICLDSEARQMVLARWTALRKKLFR